MSIIKKNVRERRGFTLIELLVVIAIIGVLSSVVLASLNTARSKGNDAAVQSNLAGIKTQAQLYYSDNNSYTGLCTGDTTIVNQLLAADNANGADGTVTCNVETDGTAYAVSAELVSTSGTYFCVDSTGAATTTTTVLGVSTSC